MKAIQLLFNSVLPDDLKNYNQDLSAKTINKVLYAVAKKHPDQFADTLKKVADIGRKASWMQGETITLKDLVSPIDKKSILSRMRQEIAEAKAADPANFEKNRDTIWQRYNSAIEKETANAALANRNNIAMAVLSGARGKNAQLKAMISTPGTYSDYKDRIIPIFINESFAEGIRPAGFMASHPGARKSVTTAKNSTARGGDIGKQMSAAAANLVVRERDCKTHNGVMMPLDDKSLHGRVLADDAGDIKAGTLLDRQTLSQLKKSGVKEVVARDAITCTVPNGLCSKCVGAFYNGGKFPKVGASIGLVASTVTSEPVVQGSLSTKHTAGMSSGKREYGGLDVITQFIQSPEVFKDRAAVAEDDGVVERVEDAPQGGKYITVSGVKQYIPTGHDAIVKPGDRVEAGDQLSDGLIDPEDVVRLKGVGAGQLYYAQRLNKILEASGAKTDPRNTEILARAAINHVRITDPDGMGNNLPDDVVSYTQLAKHYAPPKTARVVPLQEAAGKYLQTPVLHYTIGTRLTPSVLDTLRRAKKTDVYVDDDAPQFEPEMVRLRTAAHVNPDWLASQATSYLGSQLQSAAVRGDETNIQENDDYRPRLAVGVGFGEHAETTGKF